ncbi:MAG: ATP-binding protein [Thiobacillus sp.]|nr:ATP-binding protein [Thiobacillus sp.]
MFAKSSVPFTDALTDFKRAVRQRLAFVSLPEAGILIWLLLLLAGPILVFSQLSLQDQSQIHLEPHSHLLIESFCGLTALTIAGMILSVCLRRHDPSMILFGLGFLVMGIFDMLHAWTDPGRHQTGFVLYHTLSTFLGSVFIFAGVAVRIAAERNHGLSRADLATVAVGLTVAVGVAALYRYSIPSLFPGETGELGFSSINHAAHYLAGLFYVLAGIAFYRYFREHHQILALLAFSLLVAFAQSAYLFSLSSMWNLAWWVWHGIKLLFYLGAMLIVFVGFLLALRTIEKSRHSLTQANRRLERSQRSIRHFNRELEIRNRMVQEAMLTLNLDNTLDVVSKAIYQLLGLTSCELNLRIPQDEVDEFDCRARRFSKRWPVRALREASICNAAACHPILPVQEVFECGYRDDTGYNSVCLSLTANGQEIGRLRLRGSRPNVNPGALGALANEVGAIVHNALLYHQWLDANDFRLALLRVSNMLTSTLDLDRVLEAVCKESAALLESDGALVWLPDNKNKAESFFLAAKWFAQTDQQVSTELEAWCRDGNQCSTLLQGISGHYHPVSILWRDVSRATPFSKPKGCPWEALALFPLLDGENLIGVMVLARNDPVCFSVATLDKGVLLAGQVRIAINNAQSFTRLAEFNQQLKLAEENKIRSERMAVMGQMAASVAHEVRNPLSAINNCLAVLRPNARKNSRSFAALEIIQGEVERLTNLTSNFLSFGKPRASVSKPIVLEQVVKKTCALLERHISQEGLSIQLELNIEPVSSLLLFDADGLETVFWNLLLNATQSIHGAGRIEVTLRHYPGHFLLVVTDSGKGIAREDQARIFEPFYSQRPLGAGLGLAIVQRLVREWGGGIRLRSRVGEGTAFFLRVPARIEGTFVGREVA